MLTKNGKTLFTQSLNSNGQANDRPFKNTAGTSISTGSFGWGTGKNIMNLMTGMNIVVGSGTTEPTADDYVMEQQINSLTVVQSSNSGNRSMNYNDGYIYALARTFKNNTSDPITISEVGVYSQSLPNNLGVVMYAREVIAPVTIQPDHTYTFSMTIG